MKSLGADPLAQAGRCKFLEFFLEWNVRPPGSKLELE